MCRLTYLVILTPPFHVLRPRHSRLLLLSPATLAPLVASSPVQPVPGEAWRRGPGEQAGGLGDGQRDHAGVGWGRLAGPDRERGLDAGAVPEQGGGDGADGQSGHDQHGVAGDRGVEADLDWSRPKQSLEVVTHYGASTGFRPRSSLRIRGIRWLAGGCR